MASVGGLSGRQNAFTVLTKIVTGQMETRSTPQKCCLNLDPKKEYYGVSRSFNFLDARKQVVLKAYLNTQILLNAKYFLSLKKTKERKIHFSLHLFLSSQSFIFQLSVLFTM